MASEKRIRINNSNIYKLSSECTFFEETDFSYDGFPETHIPSTVNTIFVLTRAANEATTIQYERWWNILTPQELDSLELRFRSPKIAGHVRPCPPIVNDATQVLQFTGAALHNFENNQAEAAVYFSFKAGMAYQRMLLRDAEDHSKRGMKVLRSSSLGGQVRAKTTRKINRLSKRSR
jgi:hypothetical protein